MIFGTNEEVYDAIQDVIQMLVGEELVNDYNQGRSEMKKSYLRGHKIEKIDSEWVFSDTKEPTVKT